MDLLSGASKARNVVATFLKGKPFLLVTWCQKLLLLVCPSHIYALGEHAA